MDESQRPQLTNLAFVDGRLKPEIKLVERLEERQVCQLQTCSQIPCATRIHFAAKRQGNPSGALSRGLASLRALPPDSYQEGEGKQ
jgi:hypothetical protein